VLCKSLYFIEHLRLFDGGTLINPNRNELVTKRIVKRWEKITWRKETAYCSNGDLSCGQFVQSATQGRTPCYIRMFTKK
jgi:hypothetical protein